MAGTGTGSTYISAANSLLSEMIKNDFAQNRILMKPMTRLAGVETKPRFEGRNWNMPNVPPRDAIEDPCTWDGDPTATKAYSSGVQIPLKVYYDAWSLGKDTKKVVVAGTLKEVKTKALQQALDTVELMIAQTLGWGLPMWRADGDDQYYATAACTGVWASAATDIFASTTGLGGFADDIFLGGRCCVYKGPGSGGNRCVHDSATTTGIITSDTITGGNGSNPFAEYMKALDYEADDDPTSYAYVAGPRNFPQGIFLTASAIMAADNFLYDTLRGRRIGSGYRLFVDNAGVLDLKSDPAFVELMKRNSMYFSDPAAALKKGVVGTQIINADVVFRSDSTAAGADTDANYYKSGALHYYSMVGDDTYRRLKLGVTTGEGDQERGMINLKVVNGADLTYPRPGFFVISWDYTGACVIPMASNGINIACRTSQ